MPVQLPGLDLEVHAKGHDFTVVYLSDNLSHDPSNFVDGIPLCINSEGRDAAAQVLRDMVSEEDEDGCLDQYYGEGHRARLNAAIDHFEINGLPVVLRVGYGVVVCY